MFEIGCCGPTKLFPEQSFQRGFAVCAYLYTSEHLCLGNLGLSMFEIWTGFACLARIHFHRTANISMNLKSFWLVRLEDGVLLNLQPCPIWESVWFGAISRGYDPTFRWFSQRPKNSKSISCCFDFPTTVCSDVIFSINIWNSFLALHRLVQILF